MATADLHPFAYQLLTRVRLPDQKGEGVIIERSQRANGPTRYRLRYLNAGGRPAEIKATEESLINGFARAASRGKRSKNKSRK